MTGNGQLAKGEREDLQRLIRQRERVLKSAAKQRSAELIADFENQMGSEFAFDDDAVWAKAKQEAEAEIGRAKQKIAARCRELGIPDRFAPTLDLTWMHRGYDNLIAKRREELRRMARTKIEAIEQKAVVEIELSCLDAQTQLAVAGLSSEAARAFADRLPRIEILMPKLSFAELAADADPPIAEQLVTPNAVRQRRYRSRREALRNAQALPLGADASASDEDAAP